MTLPVAEVWFAVDDFGDGIHRIREHHVDSYAIGHLWLIEGSDRSVVFDSGSGLVPPAPLIESMVDSPVVCIVSCSGYDHAGGWHTFAERACHPADVDDLVDPAAENAEISDWLTLDRFAAIPADEFDLAAHRMQGAAPTETLADGDVLDLGDRTLHVVHTPGRSPGGVSLWDDGAGVLFSGEILYDGDHGPAWPPPDPPAYAASLRRLRELPVRVVHPGHYASFDTDRFLTLTAEQLADLAER